MIHRIDAHDVLRPHALSLPNVHLHLADGITAVETENATITLEDGSVVQGDLIVSACPSG